MIEVLDDQGGFREGNHANYRFNEADDMENWQDKYDSIRDLKKKPNGRGVNTEERVVSLDVLEDIIKESTGFMFGDVSKGLASGVDRTGTVSVVYRWTEYNEAGFDIGDADSIATFPAFRGAFDIIYVVLSAIKVTNDKYGNISEEFNRLEEEAERIDQSNRGK